MPDMNQMPMLPMGSPAPVPTPTPMPVIPEQPIEPETVSADIDGEERLKEEKKEQTKVQYELSTEEKKKIAKLTKMMVDKCVESRKKWFDVRKECLDLYEGVRAAKSDPWENCSNITTMAIPTHVKLMHSKLFPAVWNENLIYWRPVSNNDVDNVITVRKFMEWVVRREMQLGDTVDDITHDLIVNGTVAEKTRWIIEYRNIRDKNSSTGWKEIAHEKCIVDNVPIDNVYLPYLWLGEDRSEFIAQDIFLRLSDINDYRNRNIFEFSDDDLIAIEKKIDENLPDDLTKKKADIEGSIEYAATKDSYPIRFIEIYTKYPINGKLIESVFTIDYNSETYVSGKPLTAVAPTGRRPWVIGQFIRRTNRPYGVGLPELMRGLAKELDAIHNQRIDAGTISIAPFFFYRPSSGLKPDKIRIGPGVGVPVDDINDVKFAQFPNNFVASFQEERIIIEYMEKLTATSAYQMGRESDIVKSRATATGTMAIISQGEQAYTLLGLRCQRIVARLLTKILEQYQSFMPSDLAKRIVGEEEAGKMELLFPEGLTPEEIGGGYDAYMVLDSTIGNKAMERQINGAILQMAPTLLMLAQDPRGYEIAKDFLLSMGKMEVEKYIGPKPQPKQQGVGGAPMDMNALMTLMQSQGGGGGGGSPQF